MKDEFIVMIFGEGENDINSEAFSTREESIEYIEQTLKAKAKVNAIDVWETGKYEIVLEHF